MRTRLLTPLLIALVVLGACTSDTGDATASVAPSDDGPSPSVPPASTAPSAAPSEAPASSPPSSSEEPIPSDDLGAFTCDLPIVEDPSVVVANIIDVRVGTHDGYDRVVFEFEQGTPELTLDRATPPFIEDGSGFPVEVEGESFLGLTMRGGSRQTDEGTSSYDGPDEFDPGFPALVNLVEGSDFERQSTWYLGLSAESCVRLFLLDDPYRLVIDVEHP